MSTWTECGSHRDYPTIDLRVTGEGDGSAARRAVLFDTGADSTYLADVLFPARLRAELEHDGLWDLEVVGSPSRPSGGQMLTKTLTAPVEISDGERHYAGEATVKYVARWDQTSFARCGVRERCPAGADRCDDRVGLVSTRLLSELEVEVSLHGPRRTLSIRRDPPARAASRAKRG